MAGPRELALAGRERLAVVYCSARMRRLVRRVRVGCKAWRKWLRPPLSLAVVLVSLCSSSLVLAQSLAVELVTKVRQGQNPVVRVSSSDRSERTEVTLTRSDGQAFTFPIGTLEPGASHEIKLDGTPGKFSWVGKVTGQVGGLADEVPLKFSTVVAPPLQIDLDRSKVDLNARRLELKLSRTAGRVQVKVLGTGGSVLSDEEHDFSGKPAGTPLTVTWSSGTADQVVRIEIRAYDEDGFFSGVALTPWSVSIPHQQVNFESGKAIIRDSETPKLEDSYQKITEALRAHREISGVKLFIAGHTDTVGTDQYNLALSRRRAQAIAKWFQKRGLRIAIYAEGFGEYSLLVKTGDNVDEPRNRRVDYILAVEPPALKVRAGYHGSFKALQ